MNRAHIAAMSFSAFLAVTSLIPSLHGQTFGQSFSVSESTRRIHQDQPGRDDKKTEAQIGLRWWGRVDGRDLLRIRKDRVWVVHEEGFPVVETDYRLQRPLPTESVTVTVKKVKGRGTVDVLEQPSRDNNYTATILIEDKKSGSNRYEVEVSW